VLAPRWSCHEGLITPAGGVGAPWPRRAVACLCESPLALELNDCGVVGLGVDDAFAASRAGASHGDPPHVRAAGLPGAALIVRRHLERLAAHGAECVFGHVRQRRTVGGGLAGGARPRPLVVGRNKCSRSLASQCGLDVSCDSLVCRSLPAGIERRM
jgi:hypothetical protein